MILIKYYYESVNLTEKKVNLTKILQNKGIWNASETVTTFDNILQSNFFKAEIEWINRKETKSAGNFRKKNTNIWSITILQDFVNAL